MRQVFTWQNASFSIISHLYFTTNSSTCQFSRAGADTDDLIASSLSGLASEDVRKRLDEKAIHAIETVIMVEYARCNNMSSEAVIKAFEGRRPSRFSDKTGKANEPIKKSPGKRVNT
jgi:hypothetical protein